MFLLDFHAKRDIYLRIAFFKQPIHHNHAQTSILFDCNHNVNIFIVAKKVLKLERLFFIYWKNLIVLHFQKEKSCVFCCLLLLLLWNFAWFFLFSVFLFFFLIFTWFLCVHNRYHYYCYYNGCIQPKVYFLFVYSMRGNKNHVKAMIRWIFCSLPKKRRTQISTKKYFHVTNVCFVLCKLVMFCCQFVISFLYFGYFFYVSYYPNMIVNLNNFCLLHIIFVNIRLYVHFYLYLNICIYFVFMMCSWHIDDVTYASPTL